MILIIDFGSQVTQLIARRVRESGRYCEILPFDTDPQRFRHARPRAIILSGSGESTIAGDTIPHLSDVLFDLNCPVLGICFGMQALAVRFGGKVEASAGHREYGHAILQVTSNGRASPLLKDVASDDENGVQVWMSHGDTVTLPPPGFQVLGMTSTCPVAIIGDDTRRIYGVQFHAEVNETVQGRRILENFLSSISNCPRDWTYEQMIDELVHDIHTQLGPEDDVLLALSGGVDSSVVACLLHRAIGARLKCVLIDTGLLRLNEANQVKEAFKQFNPDLDLAVVDASTNFLSSLEGVADPEQKRKIIGHLFIESFEKYVEVNHDDKLKNVRWLAQGTIYPDVIESANSGKCALIKSHHNVAALPERMKLRLIEPLRKLFKDEVRKLGLQLGLPSEFIWRHPFPGPGLGVRVLGAVTRSSVEKLQQADLIYLEELKAADLYATTSQAFAVLLPVKSVAVKGDARAYDEVVALRAVETVDFMTARSAELPFPVMKKIARRICNEVSGVSRVVYDLSDKPPGTIEWE